MTPAATRNSWATRILAVLAKEFVQLTRDKLTYAMILMIPVVQLLLFGYAINNEPRHLPTAVLVQDNSTLARSTLASFVNTQFSTSRTKRTQWKSSICFCARARFSLP